MPACPEKGNRHFAYSIRERGGHRQPFGIIWFPKIPKIPVKIPYGFLAVPEDVLYQLWASGSANKKNAGFFYVLHRNFNILFPGGSL